MVDGGGHDPIIGQNAADGRIRSFTLSYPDPKEGIKTSTVTTENFFKKTGKTDWVLPTAGGYFFAPSIAALEHDLSDEEPDS